MSDTEPTKNLPKSNETASPWGLRARLIVTLIKEAMKGASSFEKALMAMFGCVAIFGWGMAGFFLASGHPGYSFGAMLVAFGFFFGVLIVVSKSPRSHESSVSEPGPDSTRQGLIWTRPMAKLPLEPQNVVTSIESELNDLRNAVFVWLQERKPEARIDDIRLHIFVPAYTNSEMSRICELFMPTQLRLGMQGHGDEELRLLPGQGVAGRTFSTGKAQKAPHLNGGTMTGFSDYQLTEQQKKMIHPDLQWIITFPLSLTPDDAGQTFGVVGLHGLRHGLSEVELDALFGNIAGRLLGISEWAKRFSRVWVTLSNEERENGRE